MDSDLNPVCECPKSARDAFLLVNQTRKPLGWVVVCTICSTFRSGIHPDESHAREALETQVGPWSVGVDPHAPWRT